MKSFKSVDEYIKASEKKVQPVLKKVRQTILKVASKAEEKISYGMPGYKLNGKPLAYFAGCKNHLGFYPVPSGISKFKKELSKYKQGKGSVQFSYDKIPYNLIIKIIKFRAKENMKD